MTPRPIRRLLVANRGEIALRVIRAARELGIPTVAVYSTADATSLHVRAADDAVCIGPPAPGGSSLTIPAILSAARISGADAVHPGYGFLAENARFASLAAETGLLFVGPSPDAIARMGDKVAARGLAKELGIPMCPGTATALDSAAAAVAAAEKVGFPVLLKAAAGGGGRGMRLVEEPGPNGIAVEEAFRLASQEAKKAFGDGRMYLERFIRSARRIEIQIAGDGTRAVHLGERDCSIQRRHQKLVEEAPSPAITPALREKIGAAAVKLAEGVKYRTVGTVEFLFEPSRSEFYFMEMNTRIQVEHPVTESVTGVDLVKTQIALAAGATLEEAGLSKPPEIRGHAIECRINAEDPAQDFRPHAGIVEGLLFPGGIGVRIDSHLYPGYEVPPYYDSLLGKLIAFGATRDEAIARMRRALGEFHLEGIPTTRDFHLSVMDDPRFVSGDYDTKFLAPVEAATAGAGGR